MDMVFIQTYINFHNTRRLTMEDANKTTVETAANETETKGKGLTIGKICAYAGGALLVAGAIIGAIVLCKSGAAGEVAEAAADAAETVTE